jgi:hypothetical protein
MTAGPHCSDDDGGVTAGFGAPSHVALLQEEKLCLFCVRIKLDCRRQLAGKKTQKTGSSSKGSDLYFQGAWIEIWQGYRIS